MKKNIIFLFLLIFLTCCEDNYKQISGDWLQTSIYFTKTDSIRLSNHLTFLENGDIMINKYQFWAKYKKQKNKFHFINSDTISATYIITQISNDRFEIEGNFNIKTESNNDSTIYRKLVFIKANALEKKPYDSILYNLAKLYDIGNPDTLGNGALFFSFTPQKIINNEFISENPYKIEPKIKGIVDKTVGELPKREKLNEYSQWQNAIFNLYEWETLEYKITMENYFKNEKDDSKLYVKIWLIDK